MNAAGCVSAGWWINAGRCCWLLLLVAAVDCCCWLLLLVAGWPLLVAGWLLLLGYCLRAGKSLNNSRILMILRLRQFCRRKSLWKFSGHWWVAAETILQAKKSLNIFTEVMRKKSFEIVLEYFQSRDWIPDLWWEGIGREFRLGEIG